MVRVRVMGWAMCCAYESPHVHVFVGLLALIVRVVHTIAVCVSHTYTTHTRTQITTTTVIVIKL